MEISQLKELLNKLSLEEKIGQLIQLSGEFFSEDQAMLVGPQQKLGINQEMIGLSGSVLNVTGAKKVREIQTNYLNNVDHGIPLLFMSDIIYGYRTVYPIPLGFSTTWDPELIEKGYEIMADEAVAGGAHVTFAPMVDLVRDPRWGRCLESLGEDHFLSSLYSQAMVKGIQKELGATKGLAACVKHFAAYGAAEGGRDYNNVDMSERRLRSEYLPPYKAAIDAGTKMVMTSFNTVDGVPATGNKWLLNDILRKEWGFDGVIISDYAAVQELITHGYAEDESDATLKALEATNDIDMKTSCYANNLADLVNTGKLDSSKIDEAVWRVLCLKNELGLFEDPYRGASEERELTDIFTKENRETALEIAENSMVLLKNKENILPLAKSSKVALIGPYADSQELMGLWAVHGQMSDVKTLKEAFEEKIGSKQVHYTKGCDMLENYDFLGEFGIPIQVIGNYQLTEEEKQAEHAKALAYAKQVDVVIMALGEHTLQSGEAGSRTQLRLPEKQRELLNDIIKLGKKVILITFSGRPLVLTEEFEMVDGLIQAWFPGTEGARALTNIIFGDKNPSARLTQSFPHNEGQIPVYYNSFITGRPENSETHSGRFVSKYLDAPNQPLFSFGYGLSYHETKYKNLEISTTELTLQTSIVATIEVENLSDSQGEEVIQLYIQDQKGSVVRPVKELKGFKKVLLEPLSTTKVEFEITEEMLRFYTRDLTFESESGLFNLMLGKNSDEFLQVEFELIK
ncbi:beta-glucosidase BglX [Vagococcus intermedius]|uniref:beta-glucosidase n=1 Tax=Vagococcus intermedius TaxID=2991418 RepID=A0AAF0I8T5_9ENTE|nr:beta-glucosidase BglX [Vagococcus intermedius]WEG72842.1 beta-glucosidase BglX [Vagococcus intermedius]WEG74928.1 beta-glucosidase BglX [Vagococcus intermedius]